MNTNASRHTNTDAYRRIQTHTDTYKTHTERTSKHNGEKQWWNQQCMRPAGENSNDKNYCSYSISYFSETARFSRQVPAVSSSSRSVIPCCQKSCLFHMFDSSRGVFYINFIMLIVSFTCSLSLFLIL